MWWEESMVPIIGGRTYDLRITNALLYQLSYIGIEPGLRGKPEVR